MGKINRFYRKPSADAATTRQPTRFPIKSNTYLMLILLQTLLSGCTGIHRNVSSLLFPPYPNSDQREGEDTRLSLIEKPDDNLKPCQQSTNNSGIQSEMAPLIAPAVEFAVKEVEKFLEDEAKRYTASYTASAIGDHFYRITCSSNENSTAELKPLPTGIRSAGKDRASSKTPRELQLQQSKSATRRNQQGFTGSEDEQIQTNTPATGSAIALSTLSLQRKTQRYNANTAAMELDFVIKPTADQTAFQINPSRIALRQSKAKVAAIDITRPFGFDILAPWTIFQTFASSGGLSGFLPLRPAKVDMKAEITIHGVWLDKDQKSHADLIGSRTIVIPRVEIGECRIFKDPADLSKQTANSQQDKGLSQEAKYFCQQEGKNKEGISIINETGYLADWKTELLPAVPKSWILDNGGTAKPTGRGNYIVSVLVTEVDSFGERVTAIGNTVKSNESTITKALTGLFE